MTAPTMRAPAAMAAAIVRCMDSPEWAAAVADPDERAWLLLRALCEELHPLGAVSVPSEHALRRFLDRGDRDEAIRAGFDGRNYDELARRFRLSQRQVRRIVDEPRKQRPVGD